MQTCGLVDIRMGKMRIKNVDSICRLTGNMQTCGFLVRVSSHG